MAGYLGSLSSSTFDVSTIESRIKYHAEIAPSFSPGPLQLPKAYFATAESVRDALAINWNLTNDYYDKLNMKQAYYLSMEFLQGRALLNAIGNLELTGQYAAALVKFGHKLENVARQEPDAALGNGGLGRLASCFLDSLATLNYPAWGYGLRYKYGLFQQIITKDGQEEVAESWLEMGNPWEIVRNDVTYPIKFYGKVVLDSDGRKHWIGGEDIEAIAYDVPIPGYKTRTTLNLRLWSTKVPAKDFDLAAFNAGEHTLANAAHANAEKVCFVLYPGDESLEGKILRLKQQYTLCSASLQDIIARFEGRSGIPINWKEFPNKVAVQMNDTHPTLCIPELMRILIDIKGLSWKEAWDITKSTVSYTNHTVLPEALEKWSMELLQKLLPRHLEIIESIDNELLNYIVSEFGTLDLSLLEQKIKDMRILDNVDIPDSIVHLFPNAKKVSKVKSKEKILVKSLEITMDTASEEAGSEAIKATKSKKDQLDAEDKECTDEEASLLKPDPKLPKLIRMANLCVVGGHTVNGVAEIHSDIVKRDVFNSFYRLWPEKFQNKTNGVTPRRWIRFCNPELSQILTKWIGTEEWVVNTELLGELKKVCKMSNKIKVASLIKEKTGYVVNPDAMFDVQVKRIHEYKRQLLNILGIVYRYKKMKEMGAQERISTFIPRVCIFGGKAFATYVQAKRIVKFITDVGATINHDSDIGDLLKVVFVPDYNVSVAEMLIPASELSQHISTAGMEASGTSNMKFAMNGCVLIGTLDGANVEIRQEVGEENFFLFGAQAHEIEDLRKERAQGKFVPDDCFEEVKEYVRSGVFGPYNYDELIGTLEENEVLFIVKVSSKEIICAVIENGCWKNLIFEGLVKRWNSATGDEKVEIKRQAKERWTRMSILNTAGSYKFSSDRTIREYAKDIWNIQPVILP
ncbi:hypothetical protein HPP92_018039 [Vanilla planifolia]|uniref:Alpha-1,4 glucan phosphorylase n=1 Tax=Vanilla planifolia TaxID=51239 RepID=A0A835Q929_VANPL|nr:hypothetical protein HPP92_018039 [Vanilla planifolia]